MKYLLIILLTIATTACIENKPKEELQDTSFRKELLKVKSPNGKRRLTLTEVGYDTSNCYTQIMVAFGGTVSGVYATDGMNLGIQTYWKGNDTIIVETKKEYQAHQKWTQVQSFDEIVKVEYIDK